MPALSFPDAETTNDKANIIVHDSDEAPRAGCGGSGVAASALPAEMYIRNATRNLWVSVSRIFLSSPLLSSSRDLFSERGIPSSLACAPSFRFFLSSAHSLSCLFQP